MAVPVFPSLPGLAFPVVRTSNWNTLKGDAVSGKKSRIALYSYPIYQYELSYDSEKGGFLSAADRLALEAFFNGVQGAGSMFFYDDTDNDTATAQLFGEGDGETQTFQLVGTIGAYALPVWCPHVITDIKVGGTATSAYSLATPGQVTFNSAPASGALLTWDGTYYQPCYFDDDKMSLTKFMRALWENQSVTFSTDKF